MTNTDFLNLYRHQHTQQRMLERQLRLLGNDGRPQGVSTASYERVRRCTNDRDAADRQQYDGIMQDLQQLQAQLDAMEPRFQALLDGCTNYRDRFILRQYYCYGHTDEYISCCMDLSMRHVNRLRHELLTALDRE